MGWQHGLGLQKLRPKVELRPLGSWGPWEGKAWEGSGRERGDEVWKSGLPALAPPRLGKTTEATCGPRVSMCAGNNPFLTTACQFLRLGPAPQD